MLLKNLLSGKFSPQVAGAEDALGVGDAANATFNKAAAMAPGLAVSTARTAGDVGRTTGRVAGTAAKGTARVTGKGLAGAFWAVDKRRNNGELRDKLQRGGWIGQSKREQRQAAYWAAKNSRGQEERPAEGNVGGTPPQDPEGQSPAAPRRTGRVSGSSGTQTPQPAPTPTPASPAPRPQPASPQPAPADPQPPASPAPRPRDPRDPSGRV
jgi:hypothetical protein